MITNLKEVKELDGNIYVSMEYCNNEIEIRDKEIERLNNELKQQKLHNTHLEQEMIYIAELLGNKEQAITFTDIKIEIEKLKAEIKLLDDNRIYLNNRIDKAIEYIEEHYNYENFMYLSNEDTDILLEILKGEQIDDKNHVFDLMEG